MTTVPGNAVRSLQTMLRTLAYADERLTSVIPDGIYGSDTENAVRVFQKRYSLPVTGQTDLETWNRIVAVYDETAPFVLPPYPLQLRWQTNTRILPGQKNSHLFLIQSMLQYLAGQYANAPALLITGIHDAPSVEAVQWLQSICDLPVNGCICQKTWQHLCALYCLTGGDGTENPLVLEEDF